MKNHTKGALARRAIAALGALALALTASVAVAAPAHAAQVNVPTTPGSLTIHKYEQPASGSTSNNTGAPITVPAGWAALQNVNFSYQRINVDLADSAGWTAVQGYVANPASAPVTGAVTTVSTAADGSVAVPNLPVGAYLVTELASPGALRGGVPVTITQMAAPFVVTIPVPTGSGTWNSNVHVYPKNSVTTVSKVPGTPASPGIGSTIPWTVTVKVPQLPAGQTYTDFRITDTLDPKLAYAATSSVVFNGASIANTVSTSGQTVEWVISDLAALNAAQGRDLVVTFTTTVLRTGAIANKADVWINNPGKTGTPISTPVATTYWGAVSILKHETSNIANTLAGAEFAVYATQAAAEAGAAAGRIEVTRDAAGASIPAQSVFRTAADGTVVIPGLFAGNSTDASPIQRTYYLREITAPAGYQPTTTAIPVVVTAAGVLTPVQVAVPNPQLPPFQLPLTGGDGTLTLSLAGGAILLTAVGAALVVARRRSERAGA